MLQDYNQTRRPAGTSLYPDSYREEDLIGYGKCFQNIRLMTYSDFTFDARDKTSRSK